MFVGNAGLRAGWRVLLFLLIMTAVLGVSSFLALKIKPDVFKVKQITPWFVLVFAPLRFAAALIGAAVLARIERRKLGDYGLPWRPGWARDLGIGALWGFAALSLLLGALWLLHGFRIDSWAEQGAAALFYGVVWGVAFLFVGFAEEFMFRGYPQFTLTGAMGFWPAAILLSLCFAAVHYLNSGENVFGLLEVAIVALFFCFTLWRTGTLWFAVGCHAAWDWAQTCFYGTPDSGAPSVHHLLNTSFQGPHWLTGGSVGPEGSFLNLPLNLLMFVAVYFFFRDRKPYGGLPAASQDPPTGQSAMPA